MKTTLQVFHYECAKCRRQFDALTLPGSQYGLFLLRSGIDGDLRILDAFNDNVYEEVDVMLKRLPETQGKSDIELAELLQAIFFVACDLSPSGAEYRMNAKPACPGCGSSKSLDYWEASDPPILQEVEIAAPTHTCWVKMSSAEKLAVIRRCVRGGPPIP